MRGDQERRSNDGGFWLDAKFARQDYPDVDLFKGTYAVRQVLVSHGVQLVVERSCTRNRSFNGVYVGEGQPQSLAGGEAPHVADDGLAPQSTLKDVVVLVE